MPIVMLVGKTFCGKTTLCQALSGIEKTYKKTQAIEIIESTMDTPGEYVENRRFHHALIMASIDADCVLLLQDCTDDSTSFPPGFAAAFHEKPVFGVVSKTDLGSPHQIKRAEALLALAGATLIQHVDSHSGSGMDLLSQLLAGNGISIRGQVLAQRKIQYLSISHKGDMLTR